MGSKENSAGEQVKSDYVYPRCSWMHSHTQ